MSRLMCLLVVNGDFCFANKCPLVSHTLANDSHTRHKSRLCLLGRKLSSHDNETGEQPGGSDTKGQRVDPVAPNLQ